ncbi:hypothetical protein [Geothrix sp. SG200]|uniref:hypothetical protein n=1 Tax=Geothrix sp. SG200 TaxID=2922865 RepID=UPI001FAC6E87|nr:hypothetical protein [Geothrix sp. SG200]
MHAKSLILSLVLFLPTQLTASSPRITQEGQRVLSGLNKDDNSAWLIYRGALKSMLNLYNDNPKDGSDFFEILLLRENERKSYQAQARKPVPLAAALIGNCFTMMQTYQAHLNEGSRQEREKATAAYVIWKTALQQIRKYDPESPNYHE